VEFASKQVEPERRASKLRRAAVQIFLAICYFGLVTPMGVLLRLGGVVNLGKRFGPPSESYWTKPNRPVTLSRSFKRLR
jgi:hypothetical protein